MYDIEECKNSKLIYIHFYILSTLGYLNSDSDIIYNSEVSRCFIQRVFSSVQIAMEGDILIKLLKCYQNIIKITQTIVNIYIILDIIIIIIVTYSVCDSIEYVLLELYLDVSILNWSLHC